MKYRDYRNRTYASQIAVAPRIQLIPKFSDIKYEWPTADLRHTLGSAHAANSGGKSWKSPNATKILD